MKATSAGCISILNDGRFAYVDQDGNKRAIYLWVEGTKFGMTGDSNGELFLVEGELLTVAQLPVRD